MAWDDVKNFLGQALGDVSLFLRKPSTWGEIPDVIQARHEEAAQPQARQSLIGSPFRAGLLGVGGKDVGGQFQPDIPQAPDRGVLQPVHDPQGNPIPGVYVDPDGKFFKGGLTFPQIVEQAKQMFPGIDLNQFQPTGIQGGGIRLERRPGPVPPPPQGYEPATQVYDPKTGTWHPGTAKLPGADKGPTAIPPDQLPFTDDTPPETPPAMPQGAKTSTTTTTLPTRLNNPGNITASAATRGYPGVSGAETHGSRTFLKFDSPDSGFSAMDRLLQGPLYRDLPFEQAMRRWTTGTTQPTLTPEGRPVGYDLPAMERNLGIAPDTRIGDLNDTQRAALVREMAKREGFQGGVQPVAARPGGSRLGPSGATTEGAPPPADAAAPKPTRAEWLRRHPGSSIEYGPHGVAHIREAAPPAHRTDQERFFDEHPTATMQDWEDFLTANKGNQASARAEANALIKEKYKTFPAAAQATLSSVYAVRGLVAEMKAALADPAVAGNRGVFEGRMRAAAQKWGFSQNPGEDVFQVLQREMGVIAIKPYLAGGRGSQRWIQGLQSFTPAAGDEVPVLNTKLDQILERSNELEKDVRTAAKERVNPELGAPGPEATTTTTAPPTTTTTLPSTGDPQQDFENHLNQWRQPQ